MKKQLKNQIKNTVKRTKKDETEQSVKTVCLNIELYPDDTNYNYQEVLNKLVSECDRKGHTYAFIIHDKDVYTKNTFDRNYKLIGRKGDIKKVHCHFIVLFKNGEPVDDGDFLLNIPLPSRFVRTVPKSKIENAVLYLSHIKYPEKHFYHWSLINTNNREYIDGLHEDYRPSSAVNFVIHYIQNLNYVRFSDVWQQALNISGIGYQDYMKSYSAIKDIINQHNNDFKEKKLEYDISDKIRTDAKIKTEAELSKMFNIASTFGTTQIEHNGQMFTLVANEKKDGA